MQRPLQLKIAALTGYLPFAGEIENILLEGSNREAGTWCDRREINMVMLATALALDGFFSIQVCPGVMRGVRLRGLFL